jgi:hypothetical protein
MSFGCVIRALHLCTKPHAMSWWIAQVLLESVIIVGRAVAIFVIEVVRESQVVDRGESRNLNAIVAPGSLLACLPRITLMTN